MCWKYGEVFVIGSKDWVGVIKGVMGEFKGFIYFLFVLVLYLIDYCFVGSYWGLLYYIVGIGGLC